MTEKRIFTMAGQVASALVSWTAVLLIIPTFLKFPTSLPYTFHLYSNICCLSHPRITCTVRDLSTGTSELAVFWLVVTWRPNCGDWAQLTTEHRSTLLGWWRKWSWRNGRHLKFWPGEWPVTAATCKCLSSL